MKCFLILLERLFLSEELEKLRRLADRLIFIYKFQVNHSPSFHTDAQIDKDIKETLLSDTFDILNFQQCDKKKIIEEDRKRVRERLLQGINSKDLR